MTVADTPAKPDQTVGEKIDDASITAQVKASLRSHRSTSALKTTVETTDGVVTLSALPRTPPKRLSSPNWLTMSAVSAAWSIT